MPPELREKFAIQRGDLTLYMAGLPNSFNPKGFSSNFTRDGIQAGILFEDPLMLADQLRFSAEKQARSKDPFTGAEPGKIHHEFPGVQIRGLSTEYNACDTAAWFLIGFGNYIKLTGDSSFPSDHRRHIIAAADYTVSHLTPEGLFQESPELSGAERFALDVTYWKDSQIPQREKGKPSYPIVYSLAHVQNLEGLRCGAALLGSQILRDVSERMSSALGRLFESTGRFNIGFDRRGVIDAVSSDALTALYFLNPEDLKPEQLQAILTQSTILETPAGYRTLDPFVAETMKDKYHAETVWPSEQALIHAGARKFRQAYERREMFEISSRLGRVEEVSARVIGYLGNNNSETFVIRGSQVIAGGCDPQLWTVGAKSYFARTLAPFSSAA